MIFCPDHLKVNNAAEDYEVWSCLYGLEECTMSKFLSKNIKREDFFTAHLSNWFWKSEDDGSFNIIDKFRKLYSQKVEIWSGINVGIRAIEEVHKIKFKLN